MNFIVAVASDYAIGKDNRLLFSLPSDLKYFKEKTTGKVVVMGERTYRSLPKRPLPNRTNIVLSNDISFSDDGIIIVRDMLSLFQELAKYNSDDIFIIGGASVYNQLMDYCKLAYITKVNKKVDADTFIENVDNKSNWKVVSTSEIQHENNLDFQFVVFENNEPKTFDFGSPEL